MQTEVPTKLLAGWLAEWGAHHGVPGPLKVQLRPHVAGSDLLELAVINGEGGKAANIVFANLHDRQNLLYEYSNQHVRHG